MPTTPQVTPENRFTRRLKDPRPLLLDGGLATQLEAQGVDLHHTLWSAACLQENPDAIKAAHRAYLEAGAEVIISASYQGSRAGFSSLNLDEKRADELLRRSVSLAREAARETGRPETLVAASLGPWGATQHDASEYSGRYAISPEALEAFHAERLSVLDGADADVLACETMPNSDEVALLARLLQSARTPAWMSFCCRDGEHLQDGTRLESAVKPLIDHPRVLALAINCTAPRHIDAAVRTLRRVAPGLPVLAYPNSGEHFDADTKRWSGLLATEDIAEAVLSWLDAGARGVGGCCRIGPEHTRAMADAIDRHFESLPTGGNDS